MPEIEPKIFILTFLLGGLLPSLLWLRFWLKEDEEHPEPKVKLAAMFVLGIATVVVVLPMEKFIHAQVAAEGGRLVLWAAAEEVIKYLAVVIVLSGNSAVEEPVDLPIYLITAALGFATLENTLFLVKPLALAGTTVTLLTGGLRFLGSTLLHTVASGIIGIGMGLSLHFGRFKRFCFVLIGVLVAIALHSAFNFFIIRNNGSDYLKVFAFLWVATIIVLLLFEKLRRMSNLSTNNS